MVPEFFFLLFLFQLIHCNEYCTVNDICINSSEDTTRYLFYDVNAPEGFNLRRDVYMRYAIFARHLREKQHEYGVVKLVLPPWSFLYHWKNGANPQYLPWSTFFDVASLQSFAPVIEMYEYFSEIGVRYGKILIDEVYILQHYQDMFETNKFEEKMSLEPCNSLHAPSFYHYTNFTSENIRCLSFHGFTAQLSQILKQSKAKTILFDHAEVALHHRFGDRIYWQCRRSMRFSKNLRQLSDEFRRNFLNSTNALDKIIIPDDWRNEKYRRTALGGSYLSVHMRRRDFLRARPNEVPSIPNAAKQIVITLQELNLDKVFIATDAPHIEYEELKDILKTRGINVYKYIDHLQDGANAIIEQIICSHARYFIGTFESTFSFRIQEEREILGFKEVTTFNRLCGKAKRDCEPTSKWKIVF